MREKELGTERIISLLDEITEAGCLSLLITGGEPLLRDDFGEIYRYAKRKGLLVTVFTNGTLLKESHTELFRDLPPHGVEITLYGASAPTYERITGIAGSYEKCLAGIRRLLAGGIRVRLKTILMTLNRHEFFEIKKIADGFGVKFRFDPAISPRLNGDKSPIALRVPAEEAVEKEFSDKDKTRKWIDHLNKYPDRSVPDTLYYCGAGIFNFHLDPYGNLQPCMMATQLRHNLSEGGFLTGWREVMPRIREKKVDADFVCNRCEKREVCGFCPPFFELENGSPEVCSKYHCALSRNRFQILQKAMSGKG